MIESIENDKIKYLKHLREKKNIIKESKFIVETPHLVKEAILSGFALEIYSTSDYVNEFDIKNTIVSDKVMKNISLLDSPSKVICVCKTFDKKQMGKKVVLLDNVQDPGNVGTIIRTCVAFDVDTLVLSEGSADIYNDKVIRSSQGNIFHLNIIRCSIIDAINELKKNNIEVIGTSLEKSEKLVNEKLDSFGLVLGNEGTGVTKDVLDSCDKIIKIDINSRCESLNVGVSCGIILYALKG